MTQMPFTTLEIPFVEFEGTSALRVEKERKISANDNFICKSPKIVVPLQSKCIKTKKYIDLMNKSTKYGEKDVTFVNSKEIPFQRWYPYVEGYSPLFVKSLIEQYAPNAEVIYEPFAGTGTTLFASDFEKKDTIYSEVNPLLQFLIKGKIEVLRLTAEKRLLLADKLRLISSSIIEDAMACEESRELNNAYHKTFQGSKYFPDDTYTLVLKLRTYIDNLYTSKTDDVLADILSIAVFSCLLPVSYLKKQGDVRFRSEKEMHNVQCLEQILPVKILEIADDVASVELCMNNHHDFVVANAKSIGNTNIDRKISAVITSPPYLNGTNYFRNTKLELWFLKKLQSKDDLRDFRDEALTSGINDVKCEYDKIENTLSSHLLDETMVALNKSAYDRRIPIMAKSYFAEMNQLFSGLAKHLEDKAKIMVDIGDSIFSNVHIKTDLILAEILNNSGYNLDQRKILRQRRSHNGELVSQILLVFTYNERVH